MQVVPESLRRKSASGRFQAEVGVKSMARTTHRSSKGTKLYAVRDAEGQFKDIQTYKRAHGQDVKRTSAAERMADEKAAAKAAATKKAAKKSAPAKKTAAKKSAAKKMMPMKAAKKAAPKKAARAKK
jgi:hypothetical protein